MQFGEFIDHNLWAVIWTLLLVSFNVGVFLTKFKNKADKGEVSDSIQKILDVSRMEQNTIAKRFNERMENIHKKFETENKVIRSDFARMMEQQLHRMETINDEKYYSHAEGRVLETTLSHLMTSNQEIKNLVYSLNKNLDTNYKELRDLIFDLRAGINIKNSP